MDTGISDDYVGRIFDRLTTGNHRLYGLFLDDQLVSMGGYSIFAGRYAMLGRLRSDRRFRGKDLATELLSHILNGAFKVNGIEWVGGNTQEDNTPARRVLEKIGLTPILTVHGVLSQDISILKSDARPWKQINSVERKWFWLQERYVKTGKVFPYECYYSFPSSHALFQEEEIEKWTFFENEEQTRFIITKRDQKGHQYLHVVYPWNDFSTQKGFWETVAKGYDQMQKEIELEDKDSDTEKSKGFPGAKESFIWLDLTKDEVQRLPQEHPFEVPPAWVLYGVRKEERK
nr:GNAT family N-acetyltransferase [Evansella tamaricis]